MTGGCNCGAVRFEIDGPLHGAGYCHCTRCQRRTGGGSSAQGYVAPGQVRIVAGADAIRGWTPPDGMRKEFCGECGSHLWSRVPGGDIVGVRLGVIDGDPGVRPSVRQWVSSAAVWEPLADDGLERFAQRRP